MKILQVANGDFFSTYGGGQVYVKNLVDEMVHQQLDICVFSFVNKQSDIPFKKKNYKGIDLYEFYTKNENIIQSVIDGIKPDIIHAHAEKALFASIRNTSRKFALIITVHHGGITCPAGTLMNTKDRICNVSVSHEDCLACVLRNTRGGLQIYSLLKHIPLKFRLRIGNFLYKFPFIYFVTPYGTSSLQIANKQKEWNSIVDNVDIMIAPSNAIAKNMLRNGLNPDKIKIIPHGIPLSSSLYPNLFNLHLTKFFYIGRICYVKGIHNLLKAFIQLPKEQVELHLIGDIQGKYEQKLIKRYEQCTNIFFHGKINPNEVLDYIHNFDVLVHPAIYLEVFGLNISETLSQGKPVIATRCGGAEMQIKDNENGLLVEPDNVKELKKAMQWMMDHPEKRKTMEEKAPLYVISISEHVKTIYKTYNLLISK